MSENQLDRVRQICFRFPETTERLSHGAPTFFVRGKKVFVMFADNHHGDGRVAVWVAASPGLQDVLIDAEPDIYFKPPYVGVRGWVGIDLDKISDEDLAFHIHNSWALIAPKKLQAQFNKS